MGQYEAVHLALLTIGSGIRESPCGELMMGAQREKGGRKEAGWEQEVRGREWAGEGAFVPEDIESSITFPVPLWVVICIFFFWPLVSVPVSLGHIMATNS